MRSGGRRIWRIGIPMISSIAVGSFVMAQFVQGSIEDKETDMTPHSETEADGFNDSDTSETFNFVERSKRTISLEEEYDRIRNEHNLDNWEPIPVPKPNKDREHNPD
eukprot:TRINITY_DN1986_c0_g1_i2.p1 TRINITY_DN1986_c0_g1~~TRINITY_DN1986_c0_g1_i2.p1  ORF type:complete len:107 (-),score=21.88 TRINITY_DN1986_c0_g1_i2:36-356(-)